MVNAESSWQSSVIELAQAGNLRAIAFWINRYLVPQGICAQVLSERPGHLMVRTVCHHAPDGDRLVRFICHRLDSLNSDVIQTVRITAQLVGSSQLLWMKSAQLSPAVPSAQTAKTLPLSPPSVRSSLPPMTAATTAAGGPAPIASAPHPARQLPPPQQPSRTKPIQFVENPRPVAPANQASGPAVHPAPAVNPITGAAAPPLRVLRKKRRPKRPLLTRWSRTTVQQVAALPQAVRQLSTQSIDWFTGQTLPVRTLTLGGSAVAIFFVGCGFELVRQYVVDPAFRESTTASYTPKHTVGTVKAALERVPVIQADVADPNDPAITLLFSNSAALGGVPKASMDVNSASLDGANREPTGGIAAYRQADLIMTSLDNALTLQQLIPSPGATPLERGDTSQANLPIPEQSAIRRDTPRSDRSATDENPSESDASEAPETSEDSAKQPPVNIHELLANGIDIVNLANDPSPQAESAELVQTIDVLHRSEIQPLGVGNDVKEARRPRIFQVKGQRIAYLGYAESPPADEAAEDGVAPELIQQVSEDIHALRDQVDWIVVSFHWQQDLRAYPEDWQASLAHLAIDQGADLVVGYHPQVTQGAEIYKGRAIAYSLGSSIAKYMDESGESGEAAATDRDTVTLKVSLQDKQMQLDFLPVQIRQGEAALATGEAASKILRHFEQASSFFDHPVQSKTRLDARLRVSLPAAPAAELPTEPFLSYPESPKEE